MNRIFSVTVAAFLVCSGCSSSSDYYRERALLTSQGEGNTYTVQKRELEVRPYGKVRDFEDSEEEAKAPASPEAAVRELREGNRRFVANDAHGPRRSETRREQLVASQSPHTAVLACSDSRVPPEVVFDQGLGDLFVVRTAGEVPDSAAVASLEYAVEHLKVKAIVVMGHTSCGAVRAALETPKGKSAGSKELDRLLANIRPNIKGFSVATAGPQLESAVRAQVESVANTLIGKSKVIHHAVESGQLTISRGIYHLDSGVVDLWY